MVTDGAGGVVGAEGRVNSVGGGFRLGVYIMRGG